MSLASKINFKPSIFYPYYNTRTPLDICTGQFLKGTKGEWLLDGGAAPVNGISARSGYFKSTTVDRAIVDMMEIYPGTEYFKMDTENTSTSLERFKRYVGNRNIDIEDRIHLTNKGELTFKEYCQMLQDIGEEKIKHAKDYEIETPFLNSNTGKPLRILMPTFHSLDSISALSTDASLESLQSGIENKANNTLDMRDANAKTKLLDLFITWAYRYSLVIFITAHIGEKQDLDPSRPTPKQNQWMSQSEKITKAGRNFLFLPNLSYQITRPRPMVDDQKNPLYPSGEENNDLEKIEINRIDLKVLRGKNNITGTIVPAVMSQHLGILGDLSYYEYLRELDGKVKSGEYGPSGFLMKGYNRYSPFLGDVSFNRKNIRKICDADYRARRALELMFQFNWISRYWNLKNYPFHIPKTLEKLVEGINQSSRIVIDDVLESRGYWTYDNNEKRRYMSIMDILELIGEPEPVSPVSVPDDLTPTGPETN